MNLTLSWTQPTTPGYGRVLRLLALAAIAFALMLTGCGDGAGGDDHGHDHAHNGEHHHENEADVGADGHHHEAPHGGALIAIGDHFAHVELVVEADAGRLSLYVLDGEARGGVRVAHESLNVHVSEIDGEATDLSLTLEPIASSLTGETVGDTSHFQADHEQLAGAQQLVAELATVEIRGQTIDNVTLRYPEGNEQ